MKIESNQIKVGKRKRVIIPFPSQGKVPRGRKGFQQCVDRRETPLILPRSINESELPGREGAPSRSLARYVAKPAPPVCEPSHRHPALIRAGILNRPE